MPTPNKGQRLGGSPAHDRMIILHLVRELFLHKRIQTTQVKARRMRATAEKLITKAKTNSLHNRRIVLKKITDRTAVHELFEKIAPLLKNRPGGTPA